MINEINAELYLSQLYPECDDKWVARHKGTFYRNYSSDVMNVYEEDHNIELARDGFLKLLPDTFLSDVDELDSKEKDAKREKLLKRLHLLEEAFLPVDNIRFKQHLQIERATMPILEMKLRFILKEYFDFDIEKEDNEYVIQAAMLLPYVCDLRGDVGFVEELIRQVTGCDVEMNIKDYSVDDTSIYTMPMIEYIVHIDNLDIAGYKDADSKLQKLMSFLKERFIPFDLTTKLTLSGNNSSLFALNYNSIFAR